MINYTPIALGKYFFNVSVNTTYANSIITPPQLTYIHNKLYLDYNSE